MDKLTRFWEDFLRKTDRAPQIRFQEAFHFDVTEASANELLRLVMDGKKRATASSLEEFQLEGNRVPKAGDLYVFTDWEGNPGCVAEVTKVTLLPFKDMTFDICSREGEDDCLESWKENHRRFFEAEGKALGYVFHEEMIVVFEDFQVIYPI
jgi:uncharacterized protein YhfF